MSIKTLIFQIEPSADLELIWQYLEEEGCQLHYSNSEAHSQHIYADLPPLLKKEHLLNKYREIISIEEIVLPEINWEEQWALHENYENGRIRFDLTHFLNLSSLDSSTDKNSTIQLIPGPGFGDCSHPTTRLVIKLMSSYVFGEDVIDIGSGSGVLSFAAIALGAISAVGLDIEEEALRHSTLNREANGMENSIVFCQPHDFKKNLKDCVLLINMIQSEQEIVFSTLFSKHLCGNIVISSGILKEGRKEYLRLTKSWKWELVQELEEKGWLGFVFVTGT